MPVHSLMRKEKSTPSKKPRAKNKVLECVVSYGGQVGRAQSRGGPRSRMIQTIRLLNRVEDMPLPVNATFFKGDEPELFR